MKKSLRLLAALLALVAVIAVCSSVCFLLLESGHTCCGDNCPVCCLIRIGKAAFSDSLPVRIVFAAGSLLVCLAGAAAALSVRSATPVLLRVKLSD